MFATIKSALDLLSTSDKRKAILLVLMMGTQAGLEVGALGLIMPFISLVSDPSQISRHAIVQGIYDALGMQAPRPFLVGMGVALLGLLIFKNLFQVLLLWTQTRFLVRVQLDVERKLMYSYLKKTYLFHVQRNPAELFQNMRSVSAIINLVLSPLLNGVTELVVLVFVLSLLLWLQPLLTLVAAVVLGSIMLGTYFVIGRRMKRNGEQVQLHETAMNKWTMQSFGGIKEIKILGKEGFFLEKTMDHGLSYAYAFLRGQMMQQISRPLIEGLGFSVIILGIIIHLLYDDGNTAVLPALILFVAAAFRLMPGLNRIITSMLSIRQGTVRVNDVKRELDIRSDVEAEQDLIVDKSLHLHDRIELRDIVYRYPGSEKMSLDKLSLQISKGTSIALVGKSGAGKTTLVDLLFGLLPGYEGEVLIDQTRLDAVNLKRWRRNFGYIPQVIYLSDDTIRRNIAFGLPDAEIDDEKVARAVAAAQLDDVIARLPEGLDTMVGDRGVRLSGGQRQRIGIARALYGDPDVLILDEATSALDNETERAVSSAIDQLSGTKTIIIIAHRLSTVVHCDRIFFMQNGRVEAQGTFAELLEHNKTFREFAGAYQT